MKKIALTGVLGAGKSTVGQILTRLGQPFVSADALNRQVIAPEGLAFKPLLRLLGPKYLNKAGYFDTKKIAHHVFQDPKLLKKVEEIIHPKIYELLKEQEKKGVLSPNPPQKHKFSNQVDKKPLFFYEIPLLFEKNWDPLFSKKVVIAIDPKKQISRLQQNRDLSLKEIKVRLRFQLSQAEKIKKADYVIWNNGSLKDLEIKVKQHLLSY